MDERLESMYRRFTWRICGALAYHRASFGVHILNNLWNQARPMVGDWLAETL